MKQAQKCEDGNWREVEVPDVPVAEAENVEAPAPEVPDDGLVEPEAPRKALRGKK